MKAISLFSSAGVGETYLKDIGIDVVVGAELIEKRAQLYKHLYPDSEIVIGDISKEETKKQISKFITNDVKLLIATPPCQGVSSVGKNKNQEQFLNDDRNFLIFDVFHFIDNFDFDVVLIENVSNFLKMYFPFEGELLKISDLITKKYSGKYTIDIIDINAQDYGVPQSRPRCFIKMYKINYLWPSPKIEKQITLHDSIGHLPSLEAGEKSPIQWHFAKAHAERDVLAMKHTPTGKSAMRNEVFYPTKIDGEKVKGFHNTYKRLSWDSPCHARTTKSGEISSHNNVHPGRLKSDGTYSDARVLTILETLIVSSLPPDWNIPEWANDRFIRHVIGESVPPLLMKNVFKTLKKKRL
ncbi:DNA cytosine methyltransferase [Flavobacterium pectinovorum]|uniref:DNA cytosine methyltransferase n=1 Tax=Flavobacterium pectinovorum TaxID=29533 RepID=UPI001FADDA1A|nr:DNA cytosine methyltransferase [Flavobacterium pectinovorum]MCI9843507.1 DNA cytosine methyltransferase [Flavobacterium pectinovorum]